MKKIAIVGSRIYADKLKIKQVIHKLKEKYGDEVEIVSGECPYGADHYARKYALEMDMNYVSFPPAHDRYNQYCKLPANHYNKEYKVWHFFERNKLIAEYADYVVAFMPKGRVSNGTMDTLKHAKKLGKKRVIFD